MLELGQVISAVRNKDEISVALNSKVKTVFLLKTNIFDAKEMVSACRENNKLVFIHTDFMEGLGNDTIAIDFIAKEIKPDGIISTRPTLIKYAKSIGLYTVQRFFVVDSLSLLTIEKSLKAFKPDFIEILPGLMPNIISRIWKEFNIPVIAGGLIETECDVEKVIKAGGVSASTSNNDLWK